MLDFMRQYAALRSEMLLAITAVCDSQRFVLGPEVERFEAEAALQLAPHANLHAVGCASGTDALWLALAAAGIGPGDRVLTTAFSFFATASSILRAGAIPVFADIDPTTYNLDPSSIERVLDRSRAHGTPVRAILPVHLYGQCADWDAIAPLAARYGAILIEDAAQAWGASWRGTNAGALGAIGCFSFYPTKNLSAFGEAGLVSTPDAALAERLTMLRAHGMRRRYYHDEVGWNSRLDALQAAVLRVKLKHVAEWNAKRRSLAAAYDTLLQQAGVCAGDTEDGLILPWIDPRGVPVFHQYVVRTKRRDALRSFLTQHQIGSEIYYPVPLHLQTALQHLGYHPGDLPETERAAAEVLALPIFPELHEAEQATVVAAIRSFYR
jgi:dTDP-4-amino-4,6-dideoxygalactose transaminase